jgi:hypothetical protein
LTQESQKIQYWFGFESAMNARFKSIADIHRICMQPTNRWKKLGLNVAGISLLTGGP